MPDWTVEITDYSHSINRSAYDQYNNKDAESKLTTLNSFAVKITGAIFPSKKSMGIFVIPNLKLILIIVVK